MIGNNIRFTIIKSNQAGDDRIGGAVVTGTATYTNIHGRLANSPTQELLVQQGLEVQQLWRCQMKSMVNIEEQDTIILTAPATHFLIGATFRVINVRYPSFLDSRIFKQLMLSRIIKSRTQQY